MGYIILFLIIVLLVIDKIIQPKKQEKNEKNIDYTTAYQAKYLLTKNEWYEYKKLKQYAAEKQLQVCQTAGFD